MNACPCPRVRFRKRRGVVTNIPRACNEHEELEGTQHILKRFGAHIKMSRAESSWEVCVLRANCDEPCARPVLLTRSTTRDFDNACSSLERGGGEGGRMRREEVKIDESECCPHSFEFDFGVLTSRCACFVKKSPTS